MECCIGICSNSGVHFKYDVEDHGKISNHNWWSQKSGVFAYIEGKTVSLAKFLLGVDEANTKVLRRNKDVFDFRKENLFYKNKYKLCGELYEVECFDGRKFIIDKASHSFASQFVWHIDGNNYVITKLRSGRVVKLHRMLLGVVDDKAKEVDHINRNTLDNRVCNLRIADRSLNCYNRGISKYNTSGKTGVYKMAGYNKWCAQINVDGKRKYLGSYDMYEDAVNAREKAEKFYFT